jgi:hypothetical protein
MIPLGALQVEIFEETDLAADALAMRAMAASTNRMWIDPAQESDDQEGLTCIMNRCWIRIGQTPMCSTLRYKDQEMLPIASRQTGMLSRVVTSIHPTSSCSLSGRSRSCILRTASIT